MLKLFTRWVRPKPKFDAAHLEVTVYTREQCCCCHNALDLLKEYQRAERFRLDEVDVDSDPVLIAAYGESVPVVKIGGKVRFKGVVNPALFERLLAAESQSRTGAKPGLPRVETQDAHSPLIGPG